MKVYLFLAHLLLVTSIAVAPLPAEVKPNPLFGDGAVLQREEITVELCGQSVSTIAAAGIWQVKLKPLPVGGSFTLMTVCRHRHSGPMWTASFL